MEGKGTGRSLRAGNPSIARRMDFIADHRRIDLWCTYISDITDATLWPRYDALLSAGERARQLRFHFARDQRRYLVTRALVRTVLSRYAPVRPQEWIFSVGPRGRPDICSPRTSPPIEFNIAHSADLVLVGVTSGRTIGIDAEGIATREVDIEGLDRYFTTEERAALLALAPEARRQRFFELWTLKESYLKATGEGLALALDAFRFELPGEQGLTMHMRPGLADSPQRWRMWQLILRPGYLTAICAARSEEAPPRIIVREVVPLAREQIIDAAPSRSTG